jgi:GDP-L-fucose synthase
MSDFFEGKKVLVTGGTGLIGIPLVNQLLKNGADVTIASADSSKRFKDICESEHWEDNKQLTFLPLLDLTNYKLCKFCCNEKDYVFQLAGSKGASSIGMSKAATFFESHMTINMNMLKAAYESNVKKFLLTSTVGVYHPGGTYREEDMWNGDPHPGDKYSAWAKRMAELLAEAYLVQYGWEGVVIVRPGSVYGPWDDFDKETGMVVGSLINRFCSDENPIEVFGNVTNERDFTYSEDVAEGMMLALQLSGKGEAFNLSYGTGYSIRDLFGLLAAEFPNKQVSFSYNPSVPVNSRVLNIMKAKGLLHFNPKVSLKEGAKKTLDWYKTHKEIAADRYNVFKKEETK